MERNDNSEKVQPIWMRPAWLTAIATIITAVLSIPNVIGDYLSKQQDIEFAKTKNHGELLAQEFSIIEKTQQKAGEERVFFLNYLSRVLDDPEARKWAGEASISLRKAIDRKNKLESEKKEMFEKLSELTLSKQKIETELSSKYLALVNEYKLDEANLKREIRKKTEQINAIKENNDLTIKKIKNKVKYLVVVTLEQNSSPYMLVGRRFNPSINDFENVNLACKSSVCMGVIDVVTFTGRAAESIRFNTNLGLTSSNITAFSTKSENQSIAMPNPLSLECAHDNGDLLCTMSDLLSIDD